MTIKKYFFDRRKRDRFDVNEGGFVEFNKPYKPRLFNLGKPRTAKSAPIIDISFEGLAFEYVDHNMWSLDYDIFSISMKDENNKINQIPFKVVSDYAITRLPNSNYKRRCSIKFGQLTPATKLQLYSFINAHAFGKRSKKDRRQIVDPHFNDPERRKGIERRKKRVESNI